MIEMSLASWAWLLLAILLSSISMLRLSALFPWTDAARNAGLPFYVGLGLAPFLWGFLAVAALGLLPGASHHTHQAWMYGAAVVLNLALWRFPLGSRALATPMTDMERFAIVILALLIATIFFNTFFYPLTQYDPLEYATVGRALFATRTLDIYPLIDPAAHASGFFAPWTHPPLYVAMIYSTEVMQGHADIPGLMRLISPWFAVCTVGIIYALGCLVNRAAGLFAGIIFLTTPLYTLGTGSAVIDMLPVHGFTLMTAVIIGLRGRMRWVGLIEGIITGMALWTHSQAVLFIPLALVILAAVHGFGQWRRIGKEYALLLGVAIIVAAWPYINNLRELGAIISDTPKVVAVPSLDWVGYFELNRGIDSVTAIIQYGVFKGWFSPVAYSGIFWLMSLALCYYFWRGVTWRELRSMLLAGCSNPKDCLPWVSVFILLTYLGGVAFSALLGIDLMIRNERYMLIIVPFVALVGGWFLQALLNPAGRRAGKKKSVGLVLFLLLLHVPVFLLYCYHEHARRFDEIFVPIDETIFDEDGYGVVGFLRKHVAPDALVLSLRPADMYYAQRRMMSYLDPRLLPFYKETNPRKAWQMLKDLGINYVHIPDYPIPTIYHSALQEILVNPSWASLEISDSGYQIYHLNAHEKPEAVTIQIMSLNSMPWTIVHAWILGGRKPLFRIQYGIAPFDTRTASIARRPLNLWQRDFSTILQTGLPETQARNNRLVPVKPHTEYRVDYTLSGHSYVDAFMVEYDEHFHQLKNPGSETDRQRIGGTVLNHAVSQQMIMRVRTLPKTRYILLGMEHYGNSSLQLHAASVRELLPAH